MRFEYSVGSQTGINGRRQDYIPSMLSLTIILNLDICICLMIYTKEFKMTSMLFFVPQLYEVYSPFNFLTLCIAYTF